MQALDFLPPASEMSFASVALLLLFTETAVATEVRSARSVKNTSTVQATNPDQLWRPTRNVKNPSTVRVTNTDQLWRFQVGPGNDGVSVGTRYIALLGTNLKFVRHDARSGSGRFRADGENCEEAHRFELYIVDDGVFAIKNTKTQQWLCCEDEGGVRGGGEIHTWERFHLYLDENNDNLMIRRARAPYHFIFLWTNSVLYCGSWKSKTQGRNRFVGWKEGDKEWEASDKWVTITEFDNKAGKSIIGVELEYARGTNLERESTRAGSFSTSVSASAGFGRIFQLKISSSIHFDWSTVERSAFHQSRSERVKVDVYPGSHFKVQEAVGKYGPITIFSGHLKYTSEADDEVADEKASDMYPMT